MAAERLAALEAKVAAAVVRSRAPATLRAYRSDWADFAVFCAQLGVDALPAVPAVVAAYVAELADPPDDRPAARVSTITRRLAAIGEGHKVAGHPNPCADTLVRETMKGVRRSLGVSPIQKKGITTADIRAGVVSLPPGLAGHRDRLLLTLGFAGGFRRSELAALTVADVETVPRRLPGPLGPVQDRPGRAGPEGRDRLRHRRRHLPGPGLAHLAGGRRDRRWAGVPAGRPARPAPRAAPPRVWP